MQPNQPCGLPCAAFHRQQAEHPLISEFSMHSWSVQQRPQVAHGMRFYLCARCVQACMKAAKQAGFLSDDLAKATIKNVAYLYTAVKP